MLVSRCEFFPSSCFTLLVQLQFFFFPLTFVPFYFVSISNWMNEWASMWLLSIWTPYNNNNSKRNAATLQHEIEIIGEKVLIIKLQIFCFVSFVTRKQFHSLHKKYIILYDDSKCHDAVLWIFGWLWRWTL